MITVQQKASLIAKVKRACNLTTIRPIFMSSVMNEYGLLQINKYSYCLEKGRTLIEKGSVNGSVLRYQWDNDDKDSVVYDITHDGNEARDLEEVGVCLIEVLDSDVLSAEEFKELFNMVIKPVKENDDLYKRIKQVMLKEITKDEKSLKAWKAISFGFKSRIGTEIWQGELKPSYILKTLKV